MKSFLSQVSDYVFKTYENNFRDLWIVFPNQRSIAYFNEELKNTISSSAWLPKTLTIAEFMAASTALQKGSQVALLFKLYGVYVKISGSKESFDDFYHWGEILLNDFDDLDKYLADAKGVFLNVKDYKEIDRSIDFLTPEQLEVLQAFFKAFDPDKYSQLQENFLEIWQVLLPLYIAYNSLLKEQGLGYEGAIYRQAVDDIKQGVHDGLDKILFVGFNAITKCEEDIFAHLKRQGRAQFFWDFDHFYLDDELQEAGLFVRKYLRMFPNPKDFTLESNIAYSSRELNVMSAPTNYGQIELVGRGVSKIETDKLDKTAIVLADEGLLFPCINNLPDNVELLNTTMGYPIIESKVGSLIDLLIQLQSNSRKNSKGEQFFYYKPVLRILRHPLVAKFSEGFEHKLMEEIVSGNMFNVSSVLLAKVAVLQLIFSIEDDLFVYLNQILLFFMKGLVQFEKDEGGVSLDMEFLFAAIKCNSQLHDELQHSTIVLKGETYAGLLMKVLKNQKVPFEGEPLRGLQLMGFLETRNLDFEEVYVVSVNEGLLPSNQHKSSFIPYSLRRGFGLPTTEMHDAMYAYYFYRLLQRSKKVNLIYNSGSSGMQTGEKSRLIQQLLYHNAFKINEISHEQKLELKMKSPQFVVKDEVLMKVLSTYLDKDSVRKLTPSALSRYLQCQLRFYYHSVLRIYENDEIEEQVDARLFGNLFHTATEKLYMKAYESKRLLDKSYFDQLNSKDNIDIAIQFAFNEVFRVKKGRDFKVEGKNELVRSVLVEYIKQLLVNDKKAAPISIVGLEQELYRSVEFEVKGVSRFAKVGGLVDRIDRTGSSLRIIDYKTGSDKLFFKSLDDVFDSEKISDHKAVFQTFVYALIYGLNHPEVSFIEPMVYQVKEFYVPNADFKIKSKVEADFISGNFKSIQDRVYEKIQHLLSEIFDSSQPFLETTNEKHCIYCPYKVICGK